MFETLATEWYFEGESFGYSTAGRNAHIETQLGDRLGVLSHFLRTHADLRDPAIRGSEFALIPS
jgi:hypothetical protein